MAQTERSIEIDASSFAPVQKDVISGVAIDKIGKDRSNRECARIKMRINRMTAAEIGELSVRPIGGNVEIMRCVVASEGDGLIIEMTAKQPTRFYITHPKYGNSNEVSFNLEGGKEYRVNAELRLLYTIVVTSNFANVEVYVDGVYKGVTDSEYRLYVSDITPGKHKIKLQQGSLEAEQIVNVSSANIFFPINLDNVSARPQYVVFEVEPKWANVVVDGTNRLLDQYGCVTMMLNNGLYNYSVTANDYHADSGTIQVQGAKVEKRIALKPAFGWLSVPNREDLNGANVFVDEKHIGTAPLKSQNIKSGEHKVRVMKPMYKVYEGVVVIRDNEVATFSPKLEPDYANVTIKAGAGCQIYVDNVLKGTTTWSGRLSSGSHLLESRKENHRSTAVTKYIEASISTLHFNLAEPVPIMGTMNVVSTPVMADVYVDGKLVGRTPMMHDLLVGSHTIELRKQGFKDYKQGIRVEENNVVDVVATMTEYKEETFVETAKDLNTNIEFKGKTYIETAKGLNIKMIYVEGGTFAMGSNSGDDDEKPVHNVTLDSYYIGETEITQAQWRAVMGSNPSYFTGDNRPVERVSWDDAQAFCKKLSELTGRCYVLPTEAQWEYAARGGNQSKGYIYSGSDNIDEVATCRSNSENDHSNVKSKKPNKLGIYDMSGNVYEWCSDWYGNYSTSSQINPQGPKSGSNRVLRGGSWRNHAGSCRVANRGDGNPSSTYSNFGFRVACLPGNATSTAIETPKWVDIKIVKDLNTNIESKGKIYIETAKELNLKMIYVKGGTFAMGSTSGSDDEKPVHNVTLDSYYIGETEITQAQWYTVMGFNPSEWTGDNRPVECVSWHDAQEFCRKLSELTGKRYVLPTEAQWEYAARGGNQSKGYTYSGSNNIDEVAKCGSSSGGHSNVKSKNPNELGIYDMSGNVWEWCSDWKDLYSSSSQTNPQGPNSGDYRVLRGGSWGSRASGCHVANRRSNEPSYAYGNCGFRVVCLP